MMIPFKVFDFHVHCYPEKVAEKAIQAVGPLGLQTFFNGTVAGLRQSMQDAGICGALNLPLANTPDNTRGVNAWAAANNSGPVYSLGSIHPDDADPGKTIPWIKSLGLKGLKMHPEYQRFKIADERFNPIWESCIANDMFVLTHAGMDIAFAPPPNSDPRAIAELHRRYPALTLVVAHMGSWGMWQEVEEYLIGLPLYLDLAFTLGLMDRDLLVRLIRMHGAERVLFGTDGPWQSQKQTLEYFLQLPLNDTEKELILYRNAAMLLRLE